MKNSKDLTVIKKHVEKLGLDKKSSISMGDLSDLRTSLRKANEMELADWAENLNSPNELQDFIVNTIYG